MPQVVSFGGGVMQPLPFIESIEIRLLIDYPGYAVGNDGSLWSCRCSRGRVSCVGDWHQLKPTKHPTTGYHVVSVHNQTSRRQCKVHCLVLIAFIGSRPAGMIGLHADDNKDNNHLSNLRWGSHKDNAADRAINSIYCGAKKGRLHHFAKLTDDDIREIRRLRSIGMFYNDIGKQFGVAMTLAWKICNGKNWQHVT